MGLFQQVLENSARRQKQTSRYFNHGHFSQRRRLNKVLPNSSILRSRKVQIASRDFETERKRRLPEAVPREDKGVRNSMSKLRSTCHRQRDQAGLSQAIPDRPVCTSHRD